MSNMYIFSHQLSRGPEPLGFCHPLKGAQRPHVFLPIIPRHFPVLPPLPSALLGDQSYFEEKFKQRR